MKKQEDKKENKKENKKEFWLNVYDILAKISLFVGIFILFYITIFIVSNLQFAWGKDVTDDTLSTIGNLGDFFGGVIGSFWALTGVFLLYLTLKMQKEELGNQKEELRSTREVFETQKFETTFFNLLERQKQILNEINIATREINVTSFLGSSPSEIRNFQGKDSLKEAKIQLEKIFQTLNNRNKYSLNLQEEDQKLINTSQEYEREQQKINVQSCFSRKEYKINEKEINFYQHINTEISARCALAYAIFLTKYGTNFEQYFRGVFQILQHIKDFEDVIKKNNPDNLNTQNQSKKYIKFLQAQLSTDELTMIFYNASYLTDARDLIVHFDFLNILFVDALISEEHNNSFGINLTRRSSQILDYIYEKFPTSEMTND
ncbi:MAG: hypothetical protein J0L99_17310 [Chitinophagales bacterium]|nr:hypothetical protein [Chitinophagales bacterium]